MAMRNKYLRKALEEHGDELIAFVAIITGVLLANNFI